MPLNDVGHDKNDPLFGGFSSLQSSKIVVSPGRKKVSHGKPTEKWAIFIKAGKLCCPSAIQGTPIGKGSPYDSAWTILLCARGPLNLSKALLFGSTLAGGCPFASFPSLEQGMEVCSVHPPERRTPLRACVPEILCVSRFAARRSLARASLFRSCGSMLSLFPSKCAKYSRSGYLGERLRLILRRLSCFRSAKAQVAHCKRRMNVSR